MERIRISDYFDTLWEQIFGILWKKSEQSSLNLQPNMEQSGFTYLVLTPEVMPYSSDIDLRIDKGSIRGL